MHTKIAMGIMAAMLVAGSTLPSHALDWTDTMRERGYEAYSGPTSFDALSPAWNARAQATRRTIRTNRTSNATRAAAPSFGYGPYPDRPYGAPDIP
jgi:hypothetical protein